MSWCHSTGVSLPSHVASLMCHVLPSVHYPHVSWCHSTGVSLPSHVASSMCFHLYTILCHGVIVLASLYQAMWPARHVLPSVHYPMSWCHSTGVSLPSHVASSMCFHLYTILCHGVTVLASLYQAMWPARCASICILSYVMVPQYWRLSTKPCGQLDVLPSVHYPMSWCYCTGVSLPSHVASSMCSSPFLDEFIQFFASSQSNFVIL